MFVINEEGNKPIKVWLKDKTDIEPGCLEQIMNIAKLPSVFRHVAIMPDTHQGYGMPIGCVIATKDVIIPNSVGVDIGCGMSFIKTNKPVKEISQETKQAIVTNIMNHIPVGFNHRKEGIEFPDELDSLSQDLMGYYENEYLQKKIIVPGHYQLATLGGGNHFIELQEDSDGLLCIMLHSGSRNVGKQVCDYFNDAAKDANAKWLSSINPKWDLAFLPADSMLGREYIAHMNFAMKFAEVNRDLMMNIIKQLVSETLPTAPIFSMELNVHHNYAELENHFGQNLWVHRKGAIRAREGDIGIIPGAMGSFSYIVKGLGNKESFMSCSHGAGRRMGRKVAKELYNKTGVLAELAQTGIVIGKPNLDDVGEECSGAYKNIDEVIANEADLVTPILKLKTIAVVKG